MRKNRRSCSRHWDVGGQCHPEGGCQNYERSHRHHFSLVAEAQGWRIPSRLSEVRPPVCCLASRKNRNFEVEGEEKAVNAEIGQEIDGKGSYNIARIHTSIPEGFPEAPTLQSPSCSEVDGETKSCPSPIRPRTTPTGALMSGETSYGRTSLGLKSSIPQIRKMIVSGRIQLMKFRLRRRSRIHRRS